MKRNEVITYVWLTLAVVALITGYDALTVETCLVAAGVVAVLHLAAVLTPRRWDK